MATNYAVHPLSYLDEWLDDLDADPVDRLDRQIERLDDDARAVRISAMSSARRFYSNPDTPIDDHLARALETLTGIPASAWKRYQSAYDADRTRLVNEPDRIVIAPREIYGEAIALPVVKGAVNIVSSTDAAVLHTLASRIRARAFAHSYRDGEPAIRGIKHVFDLFHDIVGADDLVDWEEDTFTSTPCDAFRDNALILCDLPETAGIHPATRVAIMRALVRAFAELGCTLLVTTQDPYVLNALEVFCAHNNVADLLRATYVAPERGPRVHYEVQDVADNLEIIYKTFADPFQDLEDIEFSI